MKKPEEKEFPPAPPVGMIFALTVANVCGWLAFIYIHGKPPF